MFMDKQTQVGDGLGSYGIAARANRLKSLKVFCRDFLKQPELVESFKFPRFRAEIPYLNPR
jgi:hypothetical protein